jgi:hypothetical protein
VTAVLSRRLVLPAGEPAALCALLGLCLPPGFETEPTPVRTERLLVDGAVHPSVAAGLTATCAPRVAILLHSSIGDMAAALGVRGDLGGSMVRAGRSEVEVAAWPAERLGAELVRAVPPACVGLLRVTVVAPPHVIGQLVWASTPTGWQQPVGNRWEPVEPADIGAFVAPLVAVALA